MEGRRVARTEGGVARTEGGAACVSRGAWPGWKGDVANRMEGGVI